MTESKISKELFQPAHIQESEHEKILRPSLTFMQDSWIRIRKNKAALVSIIVLSLVIIMLLLAHLFLGTHTQNKQRLMPHYHLKSKVLIICHFGMVSKTSVGKK